MNVAHRSVRNAIVAMASCSLVLPVRIASAQPPAAPQAPAAAGPAEAPSIMATPPTPQPPAPPLMKTVHPQIGPSSLAREYRSLPADSSSPAGLANAERIREALDRDVQPAKWQFAETPLRDMVDQARDVLAVPIDVDHRALDEAGIDVDVPITFRAQAGTARSALRRILDPIDLTWIVRDECLLVTTRDKAAENLAIRLYPIPCGHAPAANSADLSALVDLIQNMVAPERWVVAGGPGAVQPVENPQALVIGQTEEIHEQVEALLRSLHAKGLEEFGVTTDGSAPRAPILRVHPVATAGVRADLAEKLAGLCNESLAEGADSKASVTAVGECLAVQSVSPEFHILAGQLIRGVAGVAVPDHRGQGGKGGAAF